MVTHLEPGFLECEVMWALGSITTNKASGGDGIPVESESCSIMSDSLQPHGLYIYSPWNSPGQNTGVGSFSLLQGLYPTLQADSLPADPPGKSIPVALFQILNDDAVKVLHSICQQIWKTQQWPQDWKRSHFIPIPKKGMPKNVQTTTQLHSSHTLAK